MPNNKQIAIDVLAAVGGKENVTSVTHCMTRLRFTLKDAGVPDTDRVKRIDGVLGARESGGQYQVIVGQNVPKVYDEVCELGGFAKKTAIDENLDEDKPKEKLTLRRVGKNILDYVSGSMVQLIPLTLAGGLFRCIGTVIGPMVLGLVTDTDPTYLLFYNYLFNAAMYFLPIYLGYAAARKMGASPVLGMLLGGILVSPEIVELSKSGGELVVFGVHATVIDYSQTILPMLLCVPVLYVVENFYKKVVPDALSTIFAPFLTIVTMVPVAFLALAPLGQLMGTGLSAVLNGIANMGGLGYMLAMAFVGGFWQLIVITGMHVAISMPAGITFLQTEMDAFIFVASCISMISVWGMCLGAGLRIRNKRERSLSFGYLISSVLGGVTEPALFGLLMRFRRMIPCIAVAGGAGGLVAAILGLKLYFPGAMSNFLFFMGFLTGGTENFIKMWICVAVAFITGAVLTYFFGFDKNELKELNSAVAEGAAPTAEA